MIKAMRRVYKEYQPELQKMLPEFERKTIIFNMRKELNKSKIHLAEESGKFKPLD
jgi:hypothetical protein